MYLHKGKFTFLEEDDFNNVTAICKQTKQEVKVSVNAYQDGYCYYNSNLSQIVTKTYPTLGELIFMERSYIPYYNGVEMEFEIKTIKVNDSH